MPDPSKADRAALLQRAIRLKQAAARAAPPQLPPRPATQQPRLGELQRSLWLLHRLQPRSAAYNLSSAFRLRGHLDSEALGRSLDLLLSRHRLLRSTFRPQGEGAVQVIHPPGDATIERLTAAGGDLLSVATAEARKPFDLERGPLLRLLLIEEDGSHPVGGAPEGLLLLVLHHILADERSLGFLWQDLATAYDAALDNRAVAAASEAPQEAPQYDDYVHWQDHQENPQRSADLDYWRRLLEPLPDDLQLPFERTADRRRADGSKAGGRLLQRRLDGEVGAAIRRLAATVDSTPFVVCAFAFRLLLQRLSGGRDVAFATPVSRRSHPSTASMIGYFLNPAVVRVPLDERRPVDQALRHFDGQLRQAMSHASIPFDQLVEALAPQRRQGSHPIFQSMFVYRQGPPGLRLGGLALEPVSLDLRESKFDLTLFAGEHRDGDGSPGFEIAVEYRTDRFAAVWMDQLLSCYATLLSHLADQPGQPTAAVPMLSTQQQAQLIAFAHGDELEVSAGLVPQQIVTQAGRHPDAPAVIWGDQTWSYRHLVAAARRLASELRRRGLGPGQRVGLCVERSPWMIAGLLGCHLAGAAYVPLDPSYPAERRRQVLDDAEVAAVLGCGLGSGLDGGLDGDAAATSRARWIDIARLPEESHSPAAEVTDLPGPDAELSGDLPAYILYTSGSSGRPKGVVVSHANLQASNNARLQFYGGSPGRFLLLSSIAFDSSVAGLFWSLASGGCLVLPGKDEATDPAQLARLVHQTQITSLLCVPSLYGHLLAAGGNSLGSLHTVIVAGESCPSPLVAEHFRHLPGARLLNEYGPTEATVWATVHDIEPRDAQRPVAIGRPIPGVRLEVLDALGRRVPLGVPGQGWILGPTVAQGYWRQPESTAQRFVRPTIDGAAASAMAYATGDRLSRTADGRLLFLGREDEQIKLRGFRIEPGEIVGALLQLPAVEAAAVVVRSADQLVAFVEIGRGREIGEGDGTGDDIEASLRRALAARLPDHMLPSRFVVLPELPLLPNGKVDRQALRDLPLRGSTSGGTEDGVVLDDRQQALVALWQGLLARPKVGLDDNFFRLGGHSLLVVTMASAIERHFTIRLTPAEIFQQPTIRQLAQRIEHRRHADTPTYAHLFPIQPGGQGAPLIFCVPHVFSDMMAQRLRGERPVYGLRGVSLRAEGNRGRWPTLQHLGRDLVREIRQAIGDRPCYMMGYSFGASMAVEAVRQMEAHGLPVRRLILIAPMALDIVHCGPFRLQVDALRRPLEEMSAGQKLAAVLRSNHPLSRHPYQKIWRFLAVYLWRRLLCGFGSARRLVGLPLTPRILHADVRLERFRLHREYRPGKLAKLQTPTVLFNAREPATDAAATWRPHFAGPWTVHSIPDPHLGEAAMAAAQGLILQHLQDLEATP